MPAELPEEVVRAFLEAEREFVATAQFATGELAATLAVVDRMLVADPPEILQSDLNVRRLTLVQADEEAAVVAVDAFVVAHIRRRGGTTTDHAHYKGEFELRRVAGEWRIERLRGDGLFYPDMAYRPIIRVEQASFRIDLAALCVRKGTLVVVVVENTSDAPASVRIALTMPRWHVLCAEARVQPLRIEPGALDGLGVRAHPARRLPLHARIEIDGDLHEFDIEPSAAARPWVWRLRDTLTPALVLQSLLMPTLVLGVAGLSWRGFALALTIAGSFVALDALADIVSGVVCSYSLGALTAGAVEAGAGIGLMIGTGFTSLAIAIAIVTVTAPLATRFQRSLHFRKLVRRARVEERAQP